MTLSVVQFASGSQLTDTGVPGQPLLGSNPTVGNLLIVELMTNTATTGVTINTSDWTILGNNIVDFTFATNSYVLARYVQLGDLALLPALATAGACHWALAIWEVSGVSGNLSADLQQVGGTSYVQASGHGPFPISVTDYIPRTSGTLALASGGNYTDTTPPVAPSGWTSDASTGSLTNWGSFGAWHFTAPTVGTAINGSSNDFASSAQVILQSSLPAGPYIRSCYSNDPSSQFSGGGETTITGMLQTAPVPGNLVIAIINSKGWNTATLTADPFWNVGAVLTSGGQDYAFLLYRYAQPGDTAALTRFFSSNIGGSQQWGYSALEIGNVVGTWADDFQSFQAGVQLSGTSLTTGTGTTAETNTLAVIGVGQAIESLTNGASSLNNGFTNFDGCYGGMGIFVGSQAYPSSGSSVSTTISVPGSTLISYIQALFGANPTPPPPGGPGAFMLLGVGA